jgi:hypothetical protein
MIHRRGVETSPYADRVVMPMSELKASRFVVNPVARSA